MGILEEFEAMEELARKRLKVGHAYRLFYNPNNINNHTFHVRAFVDDEQVVVRTWSKRRRWWRYEIRGLFELGSSIADGHIKSLGKSK